MNEQHEKRARWRPLFRGSVSAVTLGLFPSEHSARWWFRQHGVEAVRAGAVVRLRGQWMADPDRLARLIERIGRREARRCITTVGQRVVDQRSTTPSVQPAE